MKDTYVCALTFRRDRNLKGRIYYYHVNFPVSRGDEIVVPLNVHGRLQVGEVVKIYTLGENGSIIPESKNLQYFSVSAPKAEKLPFSPERLKSAVCPFGYRKVKIPGCCNARDLGGLFYDEKHLTAYGNFLRGDLPEGDLSESGVDEVVCFGKSGTDDFGVRRKAFPSLFASEKENGFIAFDVYDEEDCEAELFPSETDFIRAFEREDLLFEIFDYLAARSGAVLLCDEFGSLTVEVICLILYDLCGVSMEEVACEREITRKALSANYKQNVKSLAFAQSVPTREQTGKTVKKLLRRIGGAERYLSEIGLSAERIERLKQRMTSVKADGYQI